jgi:hypothetical protein
MNGFAIPRRTDSSTSLCQNSSNIGPSIRTSSWTCQAYVMQIINKIASITTSSDLWRLSRQVNCKMHLNQKLLFTSSTQ